MNLGAAVAPRQSGIGKLVIPALAALAGGALIAIDNVGILVIGGIVATLALALTPAAPLWLYLGAFASMWPWSIGGLSLVKAISIATISGWAIGVVLGRQRVMTRLTAIDWAIGVLFAVAFASILIATPAADRGRELLVYGQNLMLYFIARSVTRTRNSYLQCTFVFIVGALLAAGIALWQFAHGRVVVSENLDRLAEPGVGVNNFASIELAAFAMIIGLALATRLTFARLLAVPASILLLAAMIESQSRGAFVAIVALAPVMAYVFRGFRQWILLGCIVAIAALLLLVVPTPSEWLGLSDYRTRMLDLIAGGSVLDTSRPHLWRMALVGFAQHPLTGLGVGNFVSPGVWNSLALAARVPIDVFGPNDAHSFFLGSLSDLGLAGAIPLVIALVACYRGTLEALRSASARPEVRSVVYAGVFGLAAYFTAAALLPVQDFPLPYVLLGMGANLPAAAADIQ